MSMNPEIKERWAQALESGAYTQGRSALRSGETFCCLGVLCDLAVKAGVVTQVETGGGNYVYGESLSMALPPHEVLAWAGLDRASPTAGGEELTNMNDNLGCDFHQIAQQIREGL